MKLKKSNSKQSSTKSKATIAPMSLQSSQLAVQNKPKTPNETNDNEELVNTIRKVVKEKLEDHEKIFCEILKYHLKTKKGKIKFQMKLLNSSKVLSSLR